jgi:hypothetical protein
MAGRFTEEIDGEGVAWAAAGFVASLLIGVAIEPFRGTVGLENVALGYLLVGEPAGGGPSKRTPKPASSVSSTRSPARRPLVRALTVSPPKASTRSWTPAGW